QQTYAHVSSGVARPHAHVRTVRSEHLNDRADVADPAVLSVILFDRFHLRSYVRSHPGLINRHSSLSRLRVRAACYVTLAAPPWGDAGHFRRATRADAAHPESEPPRHRPLPESARRPARAP